MRAKHSRIVRPQFFVNLKIAIFPFRLPIPNYILLAVFLGILFLFFLSFLRSSYNLQFEFPQFTICSRNPFNPFTKFRNETLQNYSIKCKYEANAPAKLSSESISIFTMFDVFDYIDFRSKT